MKKIFLGSLFACMMLALVAGDTPTYGAVSSGLRAGISATLASHLSTKEEVLAQIEANKERMVGVADDGTFCGYTNLGIAIPDEGSNLNVRAVAGTDGRLVGKMKYGAGCEVLEEVDGWYHITSGDVDGYVYGEYLATGDDAMAIGKEEVALIATVTDSGLRIRSAASTDSKILDTIAAGEKLEVVEEGDEWMTVLVNNNDCAYVYAEYVTLAYELPLANTMEEIRYGSSVSSLRARICDYALQFIGNPYVWGGTSLTRGCDCSGYVLAVYRDIAGIYLDHYSGSQANAGKRISASEAQPGDLFFYGSGGVINHVGIYLGNGRLAQASSPREGIITSSAYFRTPVCVVSLLD